VRAEAGVTRLLREAKRVPHPISANLPFEGAVRKVHPRSSNLEQRRRRFVMYIGVGALVVILIIVLLIILL
jgi:Tfp pilus assembly protein PilN